MNKKTTLLSLCLFVFAFTQFVNSQVIYNNGPFSTGAVSTNATPAPAGFTWSELQAPNTTLGVGGIYNNALTTNLTLADDFVVPAGEVWNVTAVNVFGYQTGFTGTTDPPIDVLRVRIWNGDPADPASTVVAGDLTTNVFNLANSGQAFVYRTATATGTTRRVWRYNGAITATLPAGTYWIDYQVHTINDAAAFFPPVTILNTPSDPSWNAKQSTAGVFANLTDGGSTNQLALPFEVLGTITLGVNENSFDVTVTVSPNPVKNIVSIETSTDVEISAIQIYDINGKVIKNITNVSSLELNVSELSAGNYIMKLTSDKGTISKKFIKE